MKNNYLWAILAFAGAGAATYFIVRATTKGKRDEKANSRAKEMAAKGASVETSSNVVDDSVKVGGAGSFLSTLFGGISNALDASKSKVESEGYERYIVNTTATSLNIRAKASSTAAIVGTLKNKEYFYGKPSGAFIEVFKVNISKAEPEYTSRGFVSASFAKKA